MPMDSKQFEKNVLVHGAELNRWPEDARQAGVKAHKKSPELQLLLEDHQRFESFLQKRKYEEPSSDLAERILSASLRQEKKESLGVGAILLELLSGLNLPRPVLTGLSVAVVFAFIMGFAIGFLLPTWSAWTEEAQVNLQEFLYYEGEIL
ncbi:MAG: hypothetical protein V2A69_04610 [Pseudomonadota bacterium]